MDNSISILYPPNEEIAYKRMTESACHDLALDLVCKNLSDKEIEQTTIMRIISNITANPKVSKYRAEVFDDIHRLPKLRKEIVELLNEVQFLKDFGSFKRDYDKKASIWDLLHRLEEINDYIVCVEKISKSLNDADIKSEGLQNLKKYVDNLYFDSGFADMKKDIASLKATTQNIRSITVGINLNERFETESVGVVSVNNKSFKHSAIVSNFARAISSKNELHEGTEWNGSMHYQPVSEDADIALDLLSKFGTATQAMKGGLVGLHAARTLATMPDMDTSQEVSHYLGKTVDQMLSVTVKRLREVLSSYSVISIKTMTELIPEFMYYIRFAEFVEKKMEQGYIFSKANVIEEKDIHDLTDGDSEKINDSDKFNGNNCFDITMQAKNFYNIKLMFSDTKPEDIVLNDLDFSKEHLLYILTGANRGGKTTITQAVGQLFVLAQGGIYIPGESFTFSPVDCVFTHFPADEDKTLDLGRLGEECTRFKDMYGEATQKSLMLMNETFSTTSFEEGYFIARDSARAILNKKVRTIYNTHMHKLALDIEEINNACDEYKAASLIVKTTNSARSFKVSVEAPEGLSYAKDIAEKYGVTYDMLTKADK